MKKQWTTKALEMFNLIFPYEASLSGAAKQIAYVAESISDDEYKDQVYVSHVAKAIRQELFNLT